MSGETIPLEEYAAHVKVQQRPKAALEDHARLTPLNQRAKSSFHEVICLLRSSQDDGVATQHLRKFIHVNNEERIDVEEIFEGYFRFNLGVLPHRLVQGWVLGSDSSIPGGVDFLLSVNAARDGVRGRHARIFYHNQSGVLMLMPLPRKIVILNGEELIEQEQMLSQSRMGLCVGDLVYRFEFVDAQGLVYRQTLTQLRKEGEYWRRIDFRSFDPTPSPSYFDLFDYQIRAPQGAGSFGVVSPCLKKSTGELFAVKRIQRTRHSLQLVEDELNALEILKNQNEKNAHVCMLIEILYSSGDRETIGRTLIDDVYLILDPFAPQSLLTLKGEPKTMRLRALHQTAQGLRHLHAHSIIHRDVKHDNILVVTYRPLRVVVADFGHATTDLTSVDHMKGTISFLAPEILSRKPVSSGWSEPGIWSPACDTYSYGIVFFELMHKRLFRPKKMVCRETHKALLSTLTPSDDRIDHAISTMVSVNVRQRPEMKDLLMMGFWTDLETSDNERKRSAGSVTSEDVL